MEDSEKKTKKYDGKILDYIKKIGSINITELEKLGLSRQTLRYNLRKLCNDGRIRPYIKIKQERGFVFPTDEEIFFTVVNQYEYPQDVKNLIDQMCQSDIDLAMQAFEEFIKLCDERGVVDGKKLGFALMSGMIPNSKEKVAFELTYNKDEKGVGCWNPKKKKWEGGVRDYEYFTSESISTEPGLPLYRIVVDRKKGEVYKEG